MRSVAFAGLLALMATHSLPQQATDHRAIAASSPATSGSVSVDLKDGRIDASVCFPTRSPTGNGAFVLNAGLNVARVTDPSGKPVSFAGWYNSGVDGEARIYKFEGAPSTLCVRYMGAFPVYPEHDAPNDFKGVIAFNGDSIRAAEQSVWLPLSFDERTHRRGGNTAYELDVDCKMCRFIYLNGNPPLERTRGHFSSKIPRPALLFAGTGSITKTAEVTVVNEELDSDSLRSLAYNFGRIRSFYNKYMAKPIDDQPTLLRMVTIDAKGGHEWGFSTWPTLAFSGSISRIAGALTTGGQKSYAEVSYVAHEVGHYYFGEISNPDGPYSWFLIESTAEFLSIKAQEDVSGRLATTEHLAKLQREVAQHKADYVALDRIVATAQINESYRYSYGPLLLVSLERAVGENKMRAFMRGLMNTPNLSTWADISGVATRASIQPAVWKNWSDHCIANGTRTCVSGSAP